MELRNIGETMASVFKRGRRYSCRLRIGGVDVWRSLNTSNREEALRKAADLEQAVNGRQWVRRQFDELTARAERDVHPDEAPVLCESLLANVRRLLLLVPPGSRDQLATNLSKSLLAAQTSKLAVADGWKLWIDSPRRATQPKSKTLESYSGIWRRFRRSAVHDESVTGFSHLEGDPATPLAKDFSSGHPSSHPTMMI